jgi:hypothetical protein
MTCQKTPFTLSPPGIPCKEEIELNRQSRRILFERGAKKVPY